MRPSLGGSLAGLFAAPALLALFGSCAAPTQIILHLHTDVPCTGERWRGIAIAVGEPNTALEKKAPAASSLDCGADGELGSVVLTPSGEKNAEVGLRVVAGLDRQPEECEAHQYQGCVVARRAVRFDRHDTVHVDVHLARSCIDFGCKPESTCVDGVCQPLDRVPNTLPVTSPDAGASGSGGGSDGTGSAGASAGAAGRAGSMLTGAGAVRCGDNGPFCPTTGNVCCLTVDRAAGTSTGECIPSSLCPPSSIVLLCDDENDCAEKADPRGFPGLCLLAYTDIPNAMNSTSPDVVNASGCVAYSHLEEIAGKAIKGLCNDRNRCLNDATCDSSGGEGSPLPNYSWCSEYAPFLPTNPATNNVRCGDNGATCDTKGDVCCLTVDRVAQTSTGVCQPASQCPSTSIVLKCDDASDCAAQVSPTGLSGVCALIYQWEGVERFKPTTVTGSECQTYADWYAQTNVGLGMCDRTSKCVDKFLCEETQGVTDNPIPTYFTCKMGGL